MAIHWKREHLSVNKVLNFGSLGLFSCRMRCVQMRSPYENLMLWLLGATIAAPFFYAFDRYAPDFAKTIILLVAVAVHLE